MFDFLNRRIRATKSAMASSLLAALALCALVFAYVHEQRLTRNFVGRELALHGPITSVEVFAFPTIVMPTAGPDPELFRDGCSFRAKDPTKIRQLIDDITEVDAATTSEAPDYGMNNLAVVLTSASGHRTTLTSGRKGSDSALALLSESRELGRFLEKSDALEYRIDAWIDQMPENDNDGFSSLCQGRAHRYLMDRFGKPDK